MGNPEIAKRFAPAFFRDGQKNYDGAGESGTVNDMGQRR